MMHLCPFFIKVTVRLTFDPPGGIFGKGSQAHTSTGSIRFVERINWQN